MTNMTFMAFSPKEVAKETSLYMSRILGRKIKTKGPSAPEEYFGVILPERISDAELEKIVNSIEHPHEDHLANNRSEDGSDIPDIGEELVVDMIRSVYGLWDSDYTLFHGKLLMFQREVKYKKEENT